MRYTTLIDAGTLASHLDDHSFAIVDCRFNLADTTWGDGEYRAAHIPGAVYAHLDRDLSGPKTGSNGRHPLPRPSALAATFGRFGIDRDTQVVAYDQDSGAYASRLWWLLRWLGHDSCAVLDGGYAKWMVDSGRTVAGSERRRPVRFEGTPCQTLAVDCDEVAALVGHPDWTLLDIRSPERFRGESETIDKVAGHIPGAVNYFFMRNLDADGTFLPASSLRAAYETALGSRPADHVVVYCGSGVTACQSLLALEHAGLPGARLYPGSWSEWSSDPTRPIANAEGERR